jgi:hypothetical protein
MPETPYPGDCPGLGCRNTAQHERRFAPRQFAAGQFAAGRGQSQVKDVKNGDNPQNTVKNSD